MSCPDRLQQAWQSQPDGTLGINPDPLLKTARLERWVNLWGEVVVIVVLIGVGVFMGRAAFRDIRKDWPWLISVMSDAWVVGYILFNRWRLRRNAARLDEPLLAHVEWEIKDVEHQMWLGRYTLWWYLLPIALGCVIPPVVFFAMDHDERPLSASLVPLLIRLGVFAAVFYFIHLVMKYGGRITADSQRRKLLALQTLRESLLNADREPRE
jgi:hypothetical protein